MVKKLSNLGEQRVYEELKPVADRYGAEVYRKVRVADVIDIEGLARELGHYALMAHFDFVVADREHVHSSRSSLMVRDTHRHMTRKRTSFAVQMKTSLFFGLTCEAARIGCPEK